MKSKSKVKKTKSVLPDKLSELLMVALKDLEKAEESPKHQINMRTWHGGSTEHEECEVCLAGSVMAFTLNTPHNEPSYPGLFSINTMRKLLALNHLRVGNVAAALEAINEPKMREIPASAFQIIAYELYPKLFKLRLTQLAKDLKRNGL